MNKTFKHAAFQGSIGVAREDITPPVGIYNRSWGAAQHDTAEGIHRPLTLTVLTLQSASTDAPLVLLAIDLGWFRSLKDEWDYRKPLAEALKLDPSRIMLNMSHTHSGPSVSPEHESMPGGHLIKPYLESVRQAMIRAARRALDSRFDGTLVWNKGYSDLACNRDLPDEEKPRQVVGFNPSVPADNTILVGRVTDHSGRIRATIVNYACHPVTLAWENKLISPDYVGALHELVEERTGGAPCLFLQGASGDLGPREQYVGDTGIADSNGRRLGLAVLAALEGMLPPRTQLKYSGAIESGTALGTWGRAADEPSRELRCIKKDVPLPLKELPSLAELDKALTDCNDRVQSERLRRKRAIRSSLGDGKVANVGLFAWRVGDAFILGQPNEAYSSLQIELRKSGDTVVVMNLTNGSCGYLPPAEYFRQEIYSAWQTPFEKGCLERVTEASKQAIAELK
jgi:hypothetical protein